MRTTAEQSLKLFLFLACWLVLLSTDLLRQGTSKQSMK